LLISYSQLLPVDLHWLQCTSQSAAMGESAGIFDYGITRKMILMKMMI